MTESGGRNLIVFEDDRVCPEVLRFIREYCFRMNRGVTFLILATLTSVADRPEKSREMAAHEALEDAGRLAKTLLEDFEKLGIPSRITLRVGDPGQELIRFLDEQPAFSLIVWGSDDAIPKSTPGGRAHWMVETTKRLAYPIYSVSAKHTSSFFEHS